MPLIVTNTECVDISSLGTKSLEAVPRSLALQPQNSFIDPKKGIKKEKFFFANGGTWGLHIVRDGKREKDKIIK